MSLGPHTASPANGPPPRAAWSQAFAFAVAVLLILLLLILDTYTPRGLADWQVHVVVVLVTLTVPGRWHVLATAGLCSVAVMVGFYLSPGIPDFPPWMSFFNRGMGLIVLWLVAGGGLYVRRLMALKVINTDLRREIWERQAAEQVVREQASLLDITRDAIMVRDRDNRITYWNRGAELLYGWTRAEAIGRTAGELMETPDLSDTDERQAVLTVLRDRGVTTHQARHRTRSGREVLVDVRSSAVRDDGPEPTATLVVATDITERRRIESQMRQTQRLDSIGRLAAGIAHDFNNLLTPILMAAKLLREDRPPDEKAELLTTVQAGAERGAELVRKLLSFAGGKVSPRFPVALPELLAEVQGLLAHTFPKSIRITVKLADDLPPILANPTEFTQVAMNLCMNARDAMPTGGDLTITAETVALGPEDLVASPDRKPGAYVRLTFEDTGCGIPPNIFDQVFDPFFTTKPESQGTGLGLFTVLGIMRSHDGWVEVASTSRSGTRILVDWPAASGAVPAGEPAAPPPARPAQGALVLLVDDEPLIQAAARAGLQQHGYRVETASDGQAAVDAYRKHFGDVSVVVLDVMMPRMDGAATLKALLALDPQCRILLTSGMRLPSSLTDAVRAGRARFLPKPYSMEDLISAVELAFSAYRD